MNRHIICKKCGTEYPATQYLESRVDGISSFFHQIERRLPGRKANSSKDSIDEIDLSIITVCPNCGEKNFAVGYKYFGLLNPPAFRIFLLLFIAAFICYALSMIF